jgi:hypothetical protein
MRMGVLALVLAVVLLVPATGSAWNHRPRTVAYYTPVVTVAASPVVAYYVPAPTPVVVSSFYQPAVVVEQPVVVPTVRFYTPAPVIVNPAPVVVRSSPIVARQSTVIVNPTPIAFVPGR